MPDRTASVPPPDGRVSTGNPALDMMLEGGLVARRPYLVVGPAGTGKTTLALQFLCEGIRHGERALLVTLEEPPNEARLNHRGLSPELEVVDVFDAIPDIMRYERVPFKDIASVRYSTAFRDIPLAIRMSPELSAVEVTMAALEQMLRTEVLRKGYSRVAIDSLTALQYFCMKGFEPVAGAQAFLRFLSDLRVTTILTVESPLEDVETPERAIARGEIRLFRWELDNLSVRAIGVEKFRGSPHDVRLHPYRIGPRGIDINLDVTISRDTRQIIETPRPAMPVPTPIPLAEVISPVDPLAEEVRDLVLVGAEVGPVRTEIEAALGAAEAGDIERSRGHISRATALAIGLSDSLRKPTRGASPPAPDVAEAYQRIVQRGEAARAGLPPTKLPPPKVLEVQLEWVLSLIPAVTVPAASAPPSLEAAPEPTRPETEVKSTEAVRRTVEARPSVPTVRATTEPPVPVPPEEPARPVGPTSGTGKVPSAGEPPSPTKERPSIVPPPSSLPRPLPAMPARPPPRPFSIVGAPALPQGPVERRVRSRTEPVKPAPGREHPTPVAAPVPPPGARERPPLPRPAAPAPPEAGPVVPPSPAAPPAAPEPGVRAEPPVVAAPTVPPTGGILPASETIPVSPSPAPPIKRRRRAPTAARRKAPAPVPSPEPAPAESETQPEAMPAGGESLLSPASPAPAASIPGPEAPVPPKPKKRAARRRKAPPVVVATAGPIPAETPEVAPPSPPSPEPEDRPKEPE